MSLSSWTTVPRDYQVSSTCYGQLDTSGVPFETEPVFDDYETLQDAENQSFRSLAFPASIAIARHDWLLPREGWPEAEKSSPQTISNAMQELLVGNETVFTRLDA